MPKELDRAGFTDDNGSDTQLTGIEKKELAELRSEKCRLGMEVDIVKCAAASFAPVL